MGKLHRDENDGAAMEYRSGEKKYYCQNKLHRINGPAIVINDVAESEKKYYKNEKNEWFLNDVGVTENVHKKAVELYEELNDWNLIMFLIIDDFENDSLEETEWKWQWKKDEEEIFETCNMKQD